MQTIKNEKYSLIKNSIFNVCKTLLGIVFPIITFSYSARILGAEEIGKVYFVRGFVSYFMLIALFGMNYYGTREIAKKRGDIDEISIFTHEMFLISSIASIIALLLLWISIIAFSLQSYTKILLIFSLCIPLQTIGIEWFYQGTENYKYITVRLLIFQVLSLILLPVLVKNESDAIWYSFIWVLATYGANVFALYHSRKFIYWKPFITRRLKKHIPSLLFLFFMAFSVQMYVALDSTMLGFLKGDVAVGRYSAAVRINKLVNTMIGAVGAAAVPRLAYHFGRNEKKEIIELTKKLYNVIFVLSIPASIGLFMLSEEIIGVLCGKDFYSATVTMKILTPIVIIIPFSIVSNGQVFIPLGIESKVLISTCVGAITNIVGNLLLIPRYSENGAAISTVVAEMMVSLVCYLHLCKLICVKKLFRGYYQYWIASIPIVIVSLFVRFMFENYFIRIALIVPVSVVFYVIILFVFKNESLMFLYEVIRKKKNVDKNFR